MSENKKTIEIEYLINTSPVTLYNRLSTASGLAEWFADSVTADDKIFTFFWNSSEQKAELTHCVENKSVSFQWLNDDEDNTWFKLNINVDELTDDVSLIVVDNVDYEDEADSIELWNKQVEVLKCSLGSL